MSAYGWSAVGFVVAAALILGLWQTASTAGAVGINGPQGSAAPTSVIGAAPDGGNDVAPAASAWVWQSSHWVAPIDWGRAGSCLLQTTGCVGILTGWASWCFLQGLYDSEWVDCFTDYFD